MNKPLVIYHAPCLDGICSAWLLWRYFIDCDLHPAQYGDSPPDVTGRKVFVVDFSYPREVMVGMALKSSSIVVLDHHKTAAVNCEGLTFCTFDMNESGASLTQQWIIRDAQEKMTGIGLSKIASQVVGMVRDHDLWKFEIPATKAFVARARCEEFKVDLFERMFREYCEDTRLFLKEGEAILRFQEQVIAHHVKNAEMIAFAGHFVPYAICSFPGFTSDLGHELSKGHPFAVIGYPAVDGRHVYSLRSCEDGADVSAVAQLFGGGGHKHAAGFTLNYPLST